MNKHNQKLATTINTNKNIQNTNEDKNNPSTKNETNKQHY